MRRIWCCIWNHVRVEGETCAHAVFFPERVCIYARRVCVCVCTTTDGRAREDEHKLGWMRVPRTCCHNIKRNTSWANDVFTRVFLTAHAPAKLSRRRGESISLLLSLPLARASRTHTQVLRPRLCQCFINSIR